jgi:hypothetical protein
MPRPEIQAPPDVFYNEAEARKYTTSSRIIEIQVSKRSIYMFDSSFASLFDANPTDYTLFSGEDFGEGAGVARSPQRWSPQAAA